MALLAYGSPLWWLVFIVNLTLESFGSWAFRHVSGALSWLTLLSWKDCIELERPTHCGCHPSLTGILNTLSRAVELSSSTRVTFWLWKFLLPWLPQNDAQYLELWARISPLHLRLPLQQQEKKKPLRLPSDVGKESCICTPVTDFCCC